LTALGGICLAAAHDRLNIQYPEFFIAKLTQANVPLNEEKGFDHV
jgi:hypothetical protein